MNTIDAILPEIFEIRKTIHLNPELSFHEFNTTAFIEEKIKFWGLAFNRFADLQTGGFCDIGEGEIIAFRADIDALPIEEDKAHQVNSKNKGVMHACGHDYHTAIGLGLLKYYYRNKELHNKKLRVIFQPGEEAAPGGAELVLNENILENVKAILAIHVDPTLEVGKFIVLEGAVQASSTSIHIEFVGKGGHTSKPSETTDLINISAFYITQIQNLIKQKIDSRETVAFAFGAINGGATHNTIPQQIILRGTLRTHNNDVLEKCLNIMQSFTSSFAELYGIKINLNFPSNCPATINNSKLTLSFIEYLRNAGLEKQMVLGGKPSMGADDFAFYGLYVPSLYLQIGAKGSGTLHSKDLILNDELIRPTLEALTGFINSI
jgi:amidohydrolase